MQVLNHEILLLLPIFFVRQGIGTIQDAVLRQLYDDDLSVVHAALLVKELPNVVDLATFHQALSATVQRCVWILTGKYFFEESFFIFFACVRGGNVVISLKIKKTAGNFICGLMSLWLVPAFRSNSGYFAY